MRQAFAGMLWSKQFYHYDVARWLDGDPTQPTTAGAAAERPQRPLAELRRFRRHVDAGQLGVPLVRGLGPRLPLRRAGPRRSGVRQVPAAACCAGSGSSTPTAPCPPTSGTSATSTRPVQAWAALEVFAIDGGRDLDFLSRIFDKLLLNFTWWVNREDADGLNLFEGGFLGLDNIGPFDRSHLPVGGVLEQSDATGWMAFYALSMAIDRSSSWTRRAPTRVDLVVKFLEHFAGIADAIGTRGCGTTTTASSTTGSSRPTAACRSRSARWSA